MAHSAAIRKRTLLTVVVLALTLPTGSSAQSSRDTVAVAVASWLSAMGAAPYEHPAGTAAAVCLSSLVPRAMAADSVQPLSDERLREIGEALAETAGVTVLTTCDAVRAETFGAWIMGPGDVPAIRFEVWLPRFPGPTTAEVRFTETRGALWGRMVLCRLHRERTADAWLVSDCTTLLQSRP